MIIYQSKKEVHEQSERKMDKYVNGNRNLFWKESSNVNGRKVDNCCRIKNGNRKLGLEEKEMRRI